MIDCESFFARLDDVTLLAPEVSLPDELEAHANVCLKCRKELAERREAWTLLAMPLDACLPSESWLRSVEERVANLSARQFASPPTALAPQASLAKRGDVLRYVLAASVLLALTVTSKWAFDGYQHRTQLQIAHDTRHLEELAAQMQKLDNLARTYAATELKYISLNSPTESNRVLGYILFDAPANELHFFAFDLQNFATGPATLWIVNDRQELLGQTKIRVNHQGVGTTSLTLPSLDQQAVEAIVTANENPPASADAQILMRAQIP